MNQELTYGDLFSKKEISIVKQRIAQFQKSSMELARDGFHDLMQECLWAWYEKRELCHFENTSHQNAYLYTFIGNKLTDMIRARRTDKRKALYQSVSAHDEVAQDCGEIVFLIDILPDQDATMDKSSHEELKHCLSNIFSELTPTQQKVCRLIMDADLSDAEIARYMNKHRSSIGRERKRIKELFETKGLKKFL